MVGASVMVEDWCVLQSNLDILTYKITEMEEQIRKQEREVSVSQELLDESTRYQELGSELQRTCGVELLSVSDGYLELRITTKVPARAISASYGDTYEHELTIKLHPTTLAIEAAQLTPDDVPLDDLVSEVKTRSLFPDPLSVITGGKKWSKQVPALVDRIRERIYINILKNATLAEAAKDSRYKLEYVPEADSITATLPGSVTANIKVPYGWPRPGFTLHLQSLVPAANASDLKLSTLLQQCVELSNSSPEFQKTDLLQFLQATEKIVVAKKKEALTHPLQRTVSE